MSRTKRGHGKLLACLLLGLSPLGRCSGSQVGQDLCEGRECGTFEGEDCGACPLPTEVCTEAGQCQDLCEGGYSGLFDMIGNVNEWLAGPRVDENGFWYSAYGCGPSGTSGCVCRDPLFGSSRYPYWTGKTIGFRCCLTLD